MFSDRFEYELDAALEEVADYGACYLPTALSETFRQKWWRELIAGPWQKMCEQGEEVAQEFDFYRWQEYLSSLPLTTLLAEVLGDLVRHRSDLVPALADWRPNDIAVQRYYAGNIGITPHRDYKRDRLLVAVFTISGHAAFRIHPGREGKAAKKPWYPRPGSLILLRGPGLTGDDGRIYHSISAPTIGQRISVGIRFNNQLTGEA